MIDIDTIIEETKIASRKCLKCEKQFQSGGWGNRICPSCTHLNSLRKNGRTYERRQQRNPNERLKKAEY